MFLQFFFLHLTQDTSFTLFAKKHVSLNVVFTSDLIAKNDSKFLSFYSLSLIWSRQVGVGLHGGAAVSTVTLQHKGPWFKSHLGVFLHAVLSE